jgi:hypothetical protein
MNRSGTPTGTAAARCWHAIRLAATPAIIVGLAITVPATAAVVSPSAHAVTGTHQAPQTAARPREYTVLNAVSCAGPADCTAVGNSYVARGYRDLVAHWGGGADWTQLTSPPGPSLGAGLTSVACPGDLMCVATDDQGDLLQWNGSTWQPPGTVINGEMSSVACASTVSCVAVGVGALAPSLTAASWNGQSWTEHDPVVPAGALQISLDAVSCASPSRCVAVGGYSASIAGTYTRLPLAEQWNGASWSQMSVPAAPVSVLALNLAGVSCPAAASCVAVGDMDVNGKDQGLAYSWDGSSSWTAMPQPVGIPASVSCWSASGCMTTDQVGFGAGGTATPEVWNGISWAQLDPPMPNTADRELNAVDCYAQAACLLIGGAGGERPLALSWADGAWQLERVVPRAGFAGLACTPTGGCVAAGGYIDNSDNNATLTVNSGSTGWQVATTPAISGTLTDVSCESARFCVTVGGQGSNDLPLAEKWDGETWRVLHTSFGTKTADTQPLAVSCAGGRCLAIAREHYAEWWNGSSWRLIRTIPTPVPHDFAQLSDVSCVSARYCVVAGAMHRRKGPFTSFADLWNGSSFRLLKVPGNGLTSISCLSTAFCMGITVHSAVIWNGSFWRVHSLPGPSGRPGLVAVSCADERYCMAVGNDVTSTGSRNEAVLLSGRTWRVLPSPAPNTVLTDVSCAGAAPCVVVGESYDGVAATQTFAAEWRTGGWIVIPTPNP